MTLETFAGVTFLVVNPEVSEAQPRRFDVEEVEDGKICWQRRRRGLPVGTSGQWTRRRIHPVRFWRLGRVEGVVDVRGTP